jgi:signal transduction histidine kinase
VADNKVPEDPLPVRVASAASLELLRIQLEANEKLLLAAIRAHEAVDDALRAQLKAEAEANHSRAREEELRATAEFRERLIGIIGHDLRNPLSAIVMSSALLSQRGSLAPEDARLAKRIAVSGDRMTRMIGQLVDFTRARLGGGFKLRLAAADLGEICAEIVDELRLGSSAELKLRLKTEGQLVGTWDADRLARVLSNIASNAVDHAIPGTAIVIDARDEGNAVAVSVTNEGAPIAPEQLSQIFAAFRQVGTGESREGRDGHLGLGLYIASEIVRVHGGTLDVRSQGGATTFTMRLPRVVPPPP